jgi:hypothetical protein
MTFRHAVEGTPSVKHLYRPGLQALRASDRNYVSAEKSRCLAGSLNLDDALKNAQPNANRWDYGIGYRQASNQPEHVFWVEIHPARTERHREEVRKKFDWLKGWLADDGKRLGGLRRSFIWIPTGESVFTRGSPQMRALAESGLSLERRGYLLR